jgi:Glycosyl transferases group 1
LGRHAKVILTVGRQEFQKGHVHLVGAFDMLAAIRPGVELLIAGRNGNHRHSSRLGFDSRHIATASGCSATATTCRISSPPPICSCFRRSTKAFLVSPSRPWRSGSPSSLPTLREVVQEGASGLLVPPRDPAQLAEAMGRVLDDPKLARRLGDRGRELFLERLTGEQSHRRMIELYDRL